jgi:hypothetical protein
MKHKAQVNKKKEKETQGFFFLSVVTEDGPAGPNLY